MIVFILSVLGAYMLGSVSSAILVCQLFHLPDPRTMGSGNPGATNVLRVGGRFPAALTLMGDVLKGGLPVFLAKILTNDPVLSMFVLIAAVCGHLYPVFFQFKGGKGVATALGGIFALSPILGGGFVLIWGIIFAYSRYSSLSALIAMGFMPILGAVLYGHVYGLGLLLLTLIVFWKHQENIKRLWLGKENQFKEKGSHRNG